MRKKISVIVPTYKRKNLLRKCLLNLINQSFPVGDYEIIIVSDGPDEETKIEIDAHKKAVNDIRFYSLPQKKGPAAARNLGWQYATGILIAFTDDDCLPSENWLRDAWAHYKGEELIAYTGRIDVPLSKNPTDFELVTAGLVDADFVTANCFCTKKALELTGGFDEQFSAAWREDSDLEFKLLLNNIPIVRKIDAWVVHPVRKAPWGISIKDQKKSMFNALLYKKYPQLYRLRIQQKPSWYYLSILLFIGGVVALLAGLIAFAIAALSGWLLLTLRFIGKRLQRTTKSFTHVAEMVVSSFLIPFLSVYWTLYGSYKYRVLYFV
ncbi:MAG: glycosyl transferase family 2 [Segetibacter sp.]|nr:glycosyl transferase family 2 [Segetibacter sp.]